ncbi:Type IV pilus biogenesis protein PilO [Pectobacterium sp. F1-1]|uniref:hypothetical protein n=1 Tax=Pectobacterium sp. F1-1 TaxID=2949614 RepID=UPI0021D7B5E7|nr:hypothetical protein [Pectobacterium sp. F1-1]UYA62199.1 Type IV pilus biogenesis protein PilO [Pectobacterium sp. F1-1]
MISQTLLIDVVLRRPELVNKPLWQQIALQLAFVATTGLLVGWLLIGGSRQVVLGIEDQTAQARFALREIQQKLDVMPQLPELREQLAEKITQDAPFQPDRLSQLIVEPLAQAGASLLSWQPAPRHAGEPHQERWQLAFSADYTGVLQVLRELAALPYVLRIAQLSIKSDAIPTASPPGTPQLQVALALIGPEALP